MTIEPLGSSNDHLYLSFQLFFFFRNSLLLVTMKFKKGNETPIWGLYTFTTLMDVAVLLSDRKVPINGRQKTSVTANKLQN